MSDEELCDMELKVLIKKLKHLSNTNMKQNTDQKVIEDLIEYIMYDLFDMSDEFTDELHETITNLMDANVVNLFFSNKFFYVMAQIICNLSTSKTMKHLCEINIVPMLCQFAQRYIELKSDPEDNIERILQTIEKILYFGGQYHYKKPNQYMTTFERCNGFNILWQIQYHLLNHYFEPYDADDIKWPECENLTSFIINEYFEHKIELLVFGFFGKYNTNVPDEISKMIMQFYFNCRFKQKLTTFESFNKEYFMTSDDEMTLTPLGKSCYPFLIYPKCCEIHGYNKGIHYLSIHMNRVPDCSNVFGVTSQKNHAWTRKQINGFYKLDNVTSFCFKIHDILVTQDDTNWILTIKLNCNDWNIECYVNEKKFKTQNIKPNLSYYFALALCGGRVYKEKQTIFQIVRTPELKEEMKPSFNANDRYGHVHLHQLKNPYYQWTE
eukprot:229053_1